MSKIVIGVACHKAFEIPENELYLPISVGAALRRDSIAGAQPDNEGHSISEKNRQYCELTAQYWLWKNVDADYYGMCHYRRFLSFSPETFTNYTPDKRKQVFVPELNSDSKKKYCLEDVSGMRELIEGFDIIAPMEQDLSKIYTPRGRKRSVYEHFAAHDHDLINTHDLDEMIAIVRNDYPELAKDMDEYLAGPHFRGFNCFVIKRELFDELCSYEFDVLQKLEQRIDMSTYDVTRARVFGFMGEILSSAFIYHVSKTRDVKVKSVQLIYFDNTDPIVPVEPWDNSVPIVVDAIDAEPCMLAVIARSFVSQIVEAARYDVIVVHSRSMTSFYINKCRDYLGRLGNVRVTFVDWDIKSRALEDAADCAHVIGSSLHCALPWILEQYERVIVFNWNVLFCRGWDEIANVDLNGKMLAAAPDVDWIGLCNGVYGDTRDFVRSFLKIENPLNCFSVGVVVMDLQRIRDSSSFALVGEKLSSFARVLEAHESANVVYEGQIANLDLSYCVWASTDENYRRRIADLPLQLGREYSIAKSEPRIIYYDQSDPFWGEGDHVMLFWELARQSSMYERLIMGMIEEHVLAGKHGRGSEPMLRSLFNGMAPEGTRRRALVRKVIPWDSPVLSALRKASKGLQRH